MSRLPVAQGLGSRHHEPTIPPQVTYALTERVRKLDPVMGQLVRIAERWYGTGGTES
jgi:DNA-binding HxlR family transcriptional regulator